MKKFFAIAMAAVLALSATSCNEKNSSSDPKADSLNVVFGEFVGSVMKFQSANDSAFDKAAFIKGFEKIMNSDTARYYVGGMQVALQVLGDLSQLEQQGVKIDRNKFVSEFKKAINSTDSVDQMKLQEMSTTYQRLMQEAVNEAKEKDPKAIENKKAGQAFLDKKAKEAGYQKTPSGIVYKVLAEGSGDNFTEEDEVMVKYVGRHIDNKEFDKSEEPVPFRMQGVVAGFAEMLKLMKPGMKVECIIPGELAYGVNGSGEIGPNETLVFEMETVGVAPKTDKPAKPAPIQVKPVKK
ncbi:MAG: FKBP-type peptidyl-prolyl cis-trans isomerase [Muribaculaceae bacterium]|nr:FKBP-type peptidyl-prolyl cis-trans isomerase [Muribaculaceae bacterium]